MNKIGKNLIYQSSYQVLKILMPLITVPIVSHSLGSTGVGQYAFANSIAQYFVLVTALGLPLYGTREIAKMGDSKQLLSKKFWALEGFSLILTCVVLVCYFIVGFVFDLGIIYFIQAFLVIGAGLDVSWFFMGIEDFKKITLVNFLLQITSFLLIVTQIQSSQDLIKYTIILTSISVLNPLTLWYFLRTKIYFIRPNFIEMWQALKSSAVLFIPQIAIILYTNLNKTMLGALGNKTIVGIFSNALLVTTVFITLISSIDTVLMPHATRLFSQNKYDKGYIMIQRVLNLEAYFTIAIAAGIIAISDKLIPWFFGSSFTNMNVVLPILGLLVIVIPGGMSISRQYLIPQNRIKEYNNSVYLGAVISIILNFMLIPPLGAVGAAIVSVLVESLIWLIRLWDFWKNTRLGYSRWQILMNLLTGMIMVVVIKLLTSGMAAVPMTTIIQVLIGIMTYIVLTTLLKANPILPFLKQVKGKILSKS
ncbi:oligosaccharide flippase family protein [Leuconostoc mesenteroides]|uniref:oligosaccharide flippase family protein n=1 Tax=Leuconostoc mesenteroides TaxID=1245 RepID=UPI000E09AAF3|nr:oligosaccharide flippase family protein [Leuconostoc mesenteroides]MCJ2158797.1 oligosaccharide flippase family protein [Leuconostoc mesenteroides]MCM6835779.1 oligosaccharide flippase family protein [Leuconostoc mesenteroides]QAR69490.1 flippase [Leuconostoc mesenteroides]RDG15924.1 flippase [Leuconostoc mesenteroides subsp. mesenteroides]WJM73779.1 oligosaccharide flippase family protein [Leuconostoc mesenteroides]